ncbi:serine protease F56F10.1 [Aphelenchoides avenae]|nr:serine protease F56F10.1 [Aphelenchus avenae]
MGSLLRVLLPLAMCLLAVEARLPRHVTGMRRNGRTIRDRMFERITGVAADTTCPTFKEDYWPQPKDHFDPKNTDTWSQYYQINDKFFDKTKKDKPIIFLLLGGEGPIEKQWVCWENYTYMELAKQYGALVIQNEHRFFQADAAKSGWPDMKTSTLKLLTTEQAMADTAAFIDGYNKKNGFTNSVWVAFGGSYPGTIAALLRVFYPNATAGNIASSAPLYPKVDFFEYTEVMANTIRSTDQNCYNNVKDAFAQVYAMTKTTAGRTKLQAQFKTTTGSWDSILDVQNFMGEILSGFQEIIQYTYDARNSLTDSTLTIQYICDNFLNKAGDAPEVKLYNVFNFFEKANYPTFDGEMGDFSYASLVAEIQNTDISSGVAADRGWMWLSCNEFGWLQSTDLEQDNLFGNILPLSFYLQMCTDLFDSPQTPFNQGDIFARVEASHKKFGDPNTYSVS